MRHVAVIGSGPAGFYTAEALQKHYGDGISIDLIDKLPVPYGLIRSGVAPDHQSIKAVYKRYEKVALTGNVRFLGHVSVGEDVGIDELRSLYDAVILATGAPHDRPLAIPGAGLPGVIGSAAFVGWYNGHPDFADLDPPLDVQRPRSSATAMSRSTWPGSWRRAEASSPARISSATPSKRSTARTSAPSPFLGGADRIRSR